MQKQAVWAAIQRSHEVHVRAAIRRVLEAAVDTAKYPADGIGDLDRELTSLSKTLRVKP